MRTFFVRSRALLHGLSDLQIEQLHYQLHEALWTDLDHDLVLADDHLVHQQLKQSPLRPWEQQIKRLLEILKSPGDRLTVKIGSLRQGRRQRCEPRVGVAQALVQIGQDRSMQLASWQTRQTRLACAQRDVLLRHVIRVVAASSAGRYPGRQRVKEVLCKRSFGRKLPSCMEQ